VPSENGNEPNKPNVSEKKSTRRHSKWLEEPSKRLEKPKSSRNDYAN